MTEQDQEEEREPKELGPEPVDITGKEPAVITESSAEAVVNAVLAEAAKSTDEGRILRALEVVVEPSLAPELAEEHGREEVFLVRNLDGGSPDLVDDDTGEIPVVEEEHTETNGGFEDIETQIEARYLEAVKHLQNRKQTAAEELGIGPRIADLIKE
jgi:hypothetical protein